MENETDLSHIESILEKILFSLLPGALLICSSIVAMLASNEIITVCGIVGMIANTIHMILIVMSKYKGET